ncbi:hypothetical protein K466DRAFT_73821 [Polyporus arcularius HHB13444]|uniref:F-box domain-containing protein n=1 Tax=Polyporus arcularius HHB13444 TaxID=1314778 RepID=A0A5C3PJA6_9APHY|nr:hypothetical protein K466DRAFT_73821 [Polyporus arcularius HHB13444]
MPLPNKRKGRRLLLVMTGHQNSALLHVPDEITLDVLRYLDIHEILALRKTCKRLDALTRDHYAWLVMLQAQKNYAPLPTHLQDPYCWTHLSSRELERVVRRLHEIHRTWLMRQSTYFLPGHDESCVLDPLFSNDDGARTIYSVEIFLDRWLLCIFHEKLVEVWDLDSAVRSPHQPVLCRRQRVRGAGSFSSAITHMNYLDNVLTIAVSCHDLCHVIQVQLHTSSVVYLPKDQDYRQDIQFRTIAVIPFASPIFNLRAVDPAQSLLLLGLPTSFHLLNWNTRERTVVHMLSEEEEELWNGVVGAIFLTMRHILVLKAHSLEICTLLDKPKAYVHRHGGEPGADDSGPSVGPASQMAAAVHSHFFPSTTFRGVSFSRPVVRESKPHPGGSSDPGPTTVTLQFLAYDVLRGLFQCSVSVMIPPSPDPDNPHTVLPPLDVEVYLVAAHNMAIPVALGTDDGPTPRSGLSHGARGFISACALGPAGRRGVWVERRRGAVRRVVYGFNAHWAGSDDEDDEDDGVVFGKEGGSDVRLMKRKDDNAKTGKRRKGQKNRGFQPGTPISVADSEHDVDSMLARAPRAIEGMEVYEVNSYDLRDDITHVAFSETTGVIALGTRKGDIRVLGRWPTGV